MQLIKFEQRAAGTRVPCASCYCIFKWLLSYNSTQHKTIRPCFATLEHVREIKILWKMIFFLNIFLFTQIGKEQVQ